MIGDSVAWGQGLIPAQKYHSIVENDIRAANGHIGVYKSVFSHSDARIGVGDNTVLPAIPGEVPTRYPTILQQLDVLSDADRMDVVGDPSRSQTYSRQSMGHPWPLSTAGR